MLGLLALPLGLIVLLVTIQKLRPAYRVYRGFTEDIAAVNRTMTRAPVDIEGVVRPAEERLIAPFTRTECIAYEYKVKRYNSSGRSHPWQTVDSGRNAVPFWIGDQTGEVLVDPAGATALLKTNRTFDVQAGEPEPEPIEQFVQANPELISTNQSYDLGVTEIPAAYDRRYIERRLHSGDEAFVRGQTDYDVEVNDTIGVARSLVGDGETTEFLIAADDRGTAVRKLLSADRFWLLLGGTVSIVLFAIGGWTALATLPAAG